MVKIIGSNNIGNPWKGIPVDKDRRTHNVNKGKTKGSKRGNKRK